MRTFKQHFTMSFNGRDAVSVRSKADPRLDMPGKVGIGLARGSERTASIVH